MRPLSTRHGDEAGAAHQAPQAGPAPVGENGSHGEPREIQAPTRVDTPHVADPLAAAAAGPGERGRLRRRLRKLRVVRARQRMELGTLAFDARKRSNGSRPEVV